MDIKALLKRLKPVLGDSADRLWHSYLYSSAEDRQILAHILEQLYAQHLDDYTADRVLLPPPLLLPELLGEYPIGTVYYGDRALNPFALQEIELTQHVGVFGRTGAGKSFLVHTILDRHRWLGGAYLVFDWKGTYPTAHGVQMVTPGIGGFRFNPLNTSGIPPNIRQGYMRSVIELLISAYLGDLKLLTTHGVEYLLLLGVDVLSKRGEVTFAGLYAWLRAYQGYSREKDWKTSALNVLYRLVSGPLGKVMGEDGAGVESLFRSCSYVVLHHAGSSKDKAFFILSLLLRLSYYVHEQGPTKRLRLLIVLEEAHNILRGQDRERIVEVMIRQVREFGVGIIIVDQHPSLISKPALGTYCTVAFNLPLRADREAMTSALNLEEPHYLGKVGGRFAIVKLQDRFLNPFLIRTFDVHDDRPAHMSKI